MVNIVRAIKTYKNLSPFTVLRNLSTVKEEEGDEDDDAFELPLYLYLE